MATHVRYLQSMGRPVGPSILPGDELKVPDDEAERLVEKGLAEYVDSQAKRRGKKEDVEIATSRKASKAEKR